MRSPRLGKWFFSIHYNRTPWDRIDPYERAIRITFIKLIKEPAEGVMASHGKHYKGFRFVFRFRVLWFVEQWR